MADLISKQAVKELVEQREGWMTDYDLGLCTEDILRILDELPLAEPQWISINEKLPEENVPVLLGIRFKEDFKMFVTSRQDYNYWTGLGREIKGEMRWMPLPEHYKAYNASEQE